jgi:hypothetical protein
MKYIGSWVQSSERHQDPGNTCIEGSMCTVQDMGIKHEQRCECPHLRRHHWVHTARWLWEKNSIWVLFYPRRSPWVVHIPICYVWPQTPTWVATPQTQTCCQWQNSHPDCNPPDTVTVTQSLAHSTGAMGTETWQGKATDYLHRYTERGQWSFRPKDGEPSHLKKK